MKAVFMGTPDFAVPSLKTLAETCDVKMVVTQPDRPSNRGRIEFCPVKKEAMELGIRVEQPERIKGSSDFFGKLKSAKPDVIVVAAYGRILPEEILTLPKYGCINVHASLLPKYRGASPIQHAILSGDEITGVTIMQMAKGLDTGDIISQAECLVGDMHYPELSEKLARIGAELLKRTLPSIENGTATRTKQDDGSATKCGLIKKEDGRLIFKRVSANQAERMVRAYDPWPGVKCFMEGVNIKITDAKSTGQLSSETPGTVIKADKEGIDVACAVGVLRITELQAAGKKKMPAASFLLGHKIPEGTVLY